MEIENKRLQRLRMKIDHLQYKVTWIPGKDNHEADALSRAPVRQAQPEDEIDEEDFYKCLTVNAVEEALDIQDLEDEFGQTQVDLHLEEIRRAAEEDEDYQLIKKNVLIDDYRAEVWPPKLEPFRKKKDELSIEDGLLVKSGEALVIPEALRSRYLDYLSMGHLSPEKAIQRARRSVWWPHMSNELHQRRRNCKTCVERSPSNPTEPLKPHEPALYPFQKIHMDMAFYGGKQWFIVVDQFSGWPMAKNMGKEALSKEVVQVLLDTFAIFGTPEVIY
jgi:hypothetical protein